MLANLVQRQHGILFASSTAAVAPTLLPHVLFSNHDFADSSDILILSMSAIDYTLLWQALA